MESGALTGRQSSSSFSAESKSASVVVPSRRRVGVGYAGGVDGTWPFPSRVGVLSGGLHSRLWLFQALLWCSTCLSNIYSSSPFRGLRLVCGRISTGDLGSCVSFYFSLSTQVNSLRRTLTVTSILEGDKRRPVFVMLWRCLSCSQLPSQCR